MTPPVLPRARQGGGLRRAVVVVLSVVLVLAGVLAAVAGLQGTDGSGEPIGMPAQLTLLAAGALLMSLPVVLVVVPGQARARRASTALLARPRTDQLPPFGLWGGPGPAYSRMVAGTATYAGASFVLLFAGSLACLLALDEPVAAALAAGLSLLPLAGLIMVVTLKWRVGRAVERAARAGRAVPVTVVQRQEQRLALNATSRSWYCLELADGGRTAVGTPLRFSWSVEPPGALEDQVSLVVSARGRHGVLVSRARPQDAVWLLGPVPATRLPRTARALLPAPATGARGPARR